MVNIAMLKTNWLASLLLVFGTAQAQPQAVLWHEGTSNIRGATNRFSYHQAYIEWQTPMGDWYDNAGQYLGDVPFSVLQIMARGDNWQSWDLSKLLITIKAMPQLDLLLRLQPGSSGNVVFASKEQGYKLAPALVLEFKDKRQQRLNASMDSYLDNTTYHDLGTNNILRVSNKNHLLLAFDLRQLAITDLKSAKLELYRQRQSGKPEVGIYLLQQPEMKTPRYPAELAANSIFTEDFSRWYWMLRWQGINHRNLMKRVVAPERAEGSYALKVSFSTQQNLALNLSLYMEKLLGYEPESLFFEYDLYLDANWMQGAGGGKFPGFAGTYGRAGWGGRRNDGTNGWVAQGLFAELINSTDAFDQRTPLGSYIYQANSRQSHGEHHYWRQLASKIERERWVKISQKLSLNTPGETDGELLVWVDEQLVLHRTNLNFRTVSELKIERLWFNFYHGGADKPQHNMDLYITNVRVALPKK